MAISDQAAEASRRGGPLLPPDGVQLAGKLDNILDIFRMLAKQPGRATESVPTGSEERMLPNRDLGAPDPYQQRQEQLAPQMLSPEGQQRFQDAGMNAGEAINPSPTSGALDALGPDQAVVDQARQNLQYADPQTMEVRAGATDKNAADYYDAAGAIKGTGPEQVGDFVRAGADGIDFNFGRLQTGDDVKAMINEVSEIYADPIEAAKRGVITRKETLEEAETLLANEMGFTRELLKRRPGELLNAEQATAARILMTRSAERLTGLARAIRDGDDTTKTLVEFRRQMSIHAGIQMQVKGMQTEIARALGAFNIPASARTAEQQAEAAAAILADTGGRGEAKKLALGLLKAQENGGNAGLNKFALGGWPSQLNGVFQEVYVNGLLSWTYTHIKNAFATPIFMAYQTFEEVLAGVVGGVERGIGRVVGAGSDGFGRAGLGSTADGVYLGQALARVYGNSRALKDAWITAAETFRTEAPADALNKIEGAQLKAIDAENLGRSGPMGEFVDKLGRAIRIPGRSLMAVDDYWRVTSQRGELYAEAYRQAMIAKSLGKADQEAVDNAAMVILDPRSYAGQLDEAARYSTLTSDMGKLGEVASFIQKVPVVGRILMPFAKAPTNAILRWAERMGATADYFKDPVARQRAIARVSLAYGAMNLVAGYAVDGRITGAMPSDERQRSMLPPGWRPYSFVLKGDNWPKDKDGDDLPIWDPITMVPNGPLTYVSYAGLEPVGAIVGIAATTVENMRRSNNPVVRDNMAAAAMAAVKDYFGDMPMLRTIGDLTKMFEKGPAQIASGPLQSWLPYSAAVRAGERAVDPTIRRASGRPEYYTLEDVQREAEENGTPVKYELVGMVKGRGTGTAAFNDAMDKWYSMLKDRELFGGSNDLTSAVQYDVFGRERTSNVPFGVNPMLALYNMVIPFNIRPGEEPSALEREHIRLKAPLRSAKEKEQGFAFSDAFQAEWTRVAKQQIKTQNPGTGQAEGFIEALQNLIGSANYTAMTDKEQFDAIRDIEDRFYDAALEVVFAMPEYEKVARAYRDYQYVRNEFKAQGRLTR
jgi:hypothetical protein